MTQEPSANLGRTLTKRLDSIKNQYKRELVPLTKEREELTREIAELKSIRDVFLEETTVLNARNEELAQLSAVYSRRIENAQDTNLNVTPEQNTRPSMDRHRPQLSQQYQNLTPVLLPPSISSSTSSSSTIYEEGLNDRSMVNKSENAAPKKFMKWPGGRSKETLTASQQGDRRAVIEHNFQQLSILRFTRCEHCGDKMWGSQLRCTSKSSVLLPHLSSADNFVLSLC